MSSDNDVYDDMLCDLADIKIYGKVISTLNNI